LLKFTSQFDKFKTIKSIKKLKKIVFRLIIGLILFLLLLGIALSLPVVQTEIAKYATGELNKEFGTDMHIDKIAITVFGGVKIKGIFAGDKHKDTVFYINRLQTNILDIKKLTKGKLIFGKTNIDGLDLKITKYKGEDKTNLDEFIAAFDDGKEGTGKFLMKVEHMNVTSSRFRMIDENLQTPKILDFTKLKGQVDFFKIKGPVVTADIKELSLLDHRGLLVENLTSNFTYSKKNIRLEKLNLKTKESTLIGDVILKYKPKDFSDFNNKVVFDVNMEKASVSSNELNFFYNEFGKNQRFYVATHLVGTLNNFTTHDLRLLDKNDSEIIGTVNFRNLFNKKGEFYMKGNFDRVTSNYDNLKTILPRVLGKSLPETLKKLGKVDIVGDITLTKTKIDADIYMMSGLGELNSNMSMSNINNINNASYKGLVTLNNFDIGALVNEKDLGRVTLDLDVDGKGFNKKYLNTSVKGKVQRLTYNKYTYQNITIDGKMKMPYFKGYLNSNDPNLKMDFNGLVDMSSRMKNYDFQAQIDYADLHMLNFMKKDTLSIFKGGLKFIAKGNSLDDLAGKLTVSNVSYQNSRDNYFFDDFQIESTFDPENVRTITINSPDIIQGKVTGKYEIKQVRKIVENALGSLYANYSPNKLKPGQFLDFDFTIYSKIIEIFLPQVTVGENTVLKGRIDADKGDFKLDFSSPNVVAYNNTFENIRVDVDNKNPLYNAYIELDSIKTKGYKISDFSLINVTMNDTLFVRSEFKGGPKNQDFFNLNLYHTINEKNQSVVGFKKSEINFRDYLWYLNENNTKDNKVVFNKKLTDFSIEKIMMSHNDQKVELEGVLKDSTYKQLRLSFDDVDLGKVTPALDNMSFGGKLNGEVNLEQNKSVYLPTAALTVDSLVVNKVMMGDLNLEVTGEDSFRKFNVNSSIINDHVENFFLNGNIEIINKESILALNAGFTRFNISPIGPLLGSIFSDMRGFASGRASIAGSVRNPEVDGSIYLNEAGMKVPYLGVDYNFEENALINVTEDQFIFRSIELTDTKEKTKGILNGTIRHKKFDDWQLDLKLRSDNLLALDTKDNEDAIYYGTAFIKGDATITGPVSSLYIQMDAESNKGTSIKIPLNDAQGIGNNAFIHFLSKKEKEAKEKGIQEVVLNKFKGIELKFEFRITRDADIEIILDRNTGHGMKGRGEGFITMEINTMGKFNMWGDFQTYKGEYNFKYLGLIDKKFEVKEYGTIRWDGNPMNAALNLQAVYKTDANPAVILDNASFSRKVPTEVYIMLNGNLSNPEPDFKIEFPTVSSVLKSEIDYKLSDKDVRQTQALALLGTGGFMSAESASNSVYGSLFERASSIFDDIFAGSDDKFKVGFNYVQGDRTPFAQTQGKVGVTVSSQIDERITINGKFGVPVGGNQESVIVGDVEVQLRLNKDGSLKARAFNRENDINYIGEGIGYTQGIGLSYEVDFDTMRELWRKIFTKVKENNNTNPTDRLPDSDLAPDFIKFIENRKNKNAEEPKKDQKRAPEVD